MVNWNGARLHLGCGAKYLPGWINSDGQEHPVVEGVTGNPDVVVDLYKDLPAIPSDSLVQVYWSHGVEHIYVDCLVGVLAQLRRVLRPGGVLTLATTSLEGVWKHRYATHTDGSLWNMAIFGETKSTDHPFASHKQIFDGPLLWKYLIDAGFTNPNIRAWEPEQYPEIAALGDYSTRARLVSILMEAVK